MKRTFGIQFKLWQLMIVFLLPLALSGCSDVADNPIIPNEQTYEEDVPIVIFDTDIGSSTDDLFALGILYNMAHNEKCKLIGGVVSRMGEESAILIDIMNTYNGFGDLPIGLERYGVENPKVYIPYAGIADLKKDDGSPMFKRSIKDYSALPEGWQLYRKLLAAQPDHSVDICSIGFMSSLAQLLESHPDEYSPLDGVELVIQKVHALYVMGGKFGEDNNFAPGYNFGQKNAINFSIKLLDLWPMSVPIYFSPSLPGDYLDYPSDDVIKDLSWIEENPIKQVYLNYNCNTGQRMWDAYPAMMTIMGVDNFLGKKNPGFVHINKTGTTKEGKDIYEMTFEESEFGNCFYQVLQDEIQIADHLQFVKDCNTVEATVRPFIFP